MISLRRLAELSPGARERMKHLALQELDETLPDDPRLAPVPLPEANDVAFTNAQLFEYLEPGDRRRRRPRRGALAGLESGARGGLIAQA